MDFINDGLAGVYLMEQYDPDRVPVLFVHGINGYPQHFTTLIESIDKERFQAWFYFYPSAAPLRRVADHLATLLVRLQARFGFDDLAIVAHSMGGLVSRGAILDYQDLSDRDDIKLHLTISSPFGGADSAAFAASAPIELPPVFQDMAPKSDFLRWLFWQDEERTAPKRLPDGVEFHMIIGYHMPGSDDVAYDGVVTVLSQARVEAQEQAKSIRAWDYEHVPILSSPEAIERMRLLLDQRF
jgi:pimeloyl-ACP methyl ester carboxylesterase